MSYKNAELKTSYKAIILKSDTGATRNYIRGQDTIILNNPVPTNTGLRVRLLDSSVIQPTLSGNLPLQMLPSTATQAHACPNFKSASLLSIRQLCNSNCSALFKKRTSPFSTQTIPLYSMEQGTHIMVYGMAPL